MATEPTFTVYIRLPFPRGDFVDPPPTRWDSSKDEELWKILSEVSKTDLDWNELAERFEVTVDFLIQQTKFLTDRHAATVHAQVRAQMRKATSTKTSTAAASPVPGSEPANAAAEGMRRTASGSGRPLSSLSVRRVSPLPSTEDSLSNSPHISHLKTRPNVIRTNSSGSASPISAGSARLTKQAGSSYSAQVQRRRLSSLNATVTAADARDPDSPLGSPEPSPVGTTASLFASSSSSSSSDEKPEQSRIIKRPPRFKQHLQHHSRDTKSTSNSHKILGQDDEDEDEEDEDDDEAEAAFLPTHTGSSRASESDASDDPAATLNPRGGTSHKPHTQTIHLSQTSDSSGGGPSTSAARISGQHNAHATGSRSPLPQRRFKTDDPHRERERNISRTAGPLSPRRTAELAGRVTQAKGKGKASVVRESSDGTPSMGSSFSDLDDASVTQSALEEALASKMQDGGTIGSRMSTISNAIKSRYLPRN